MTESTVPTGTPIEASSRALPAVPGERPTRVEELLHEEYTIDTPENVTFGYEVAGIGNRLIGGLVDTIIVFVTQFLLYIAAIIAIDQVEALNRLFSEQQADWVNGLIVAAVVLIVFLLNWGYFVIFELIWNGQSPGKRVAKLRVVRMDGNPIGFIESAIRNLVRFGDFLPSGYAVGIIVMFVNRQSRRLGDLAAGTLVVKDRAEMRLEDLKITRTVESILSPSLSPTSMPNAPVAEPASGATEGGLDDSANEWYLRFPGLRRMTNGDFGLVNDLALRFDRGTVEQTVLRRAARAIAQKVDAEPPDDNWVAARQFLLDVSAAYSARK